jgi:hypothetical protein
LLLDKRTQPDDAPDDALVSLEQQIWSLANARTGDAEALLQVLRILERLHREIQEGPFREALPINRQALYSLLRDMEAAGGWPYIPRLQLRTFIELLQASPDPVDIPLDQAS